MQAQPVAVASDVDDVAPMHDPVQQRRCRHFVLQDLTPSFEPLVRGQHRRGPLAALQWHRQYLGAILFYAGLERLPLGDKRMFAVPAKRTMEAI